MKTILVTGSSGQLGESIKEVSKTILEMRFIFADSKTLDITNKDTVANFFIVNKIDYCINCAAYTAVDKAEQEPEKAQLINVQGAKNLAVVCNKNKTTLLHVSTDFVFDGTKNTPYTEKDTTNPQNVYGKTKLLGEKEIEKHCIKYYIIRTSWLYSKHGNNFMKTMLRIAKQRKEIQVVNNQIGTPTYAPDLAKAILKIIQSNTTSYGTYHYSNQGVASWYVFAKAIFKAHHVAINVIGIPSSDYPTPAKRPKYSVLDKEKIEKTFKIDIPNWGDSLKLI